MLRALCRQACALQAPRAAAPGEGQLLGPVHGLYELAEHRAARV